MLYWFCIDLMDHRLLYFDVIHLTEACHFYLSWELFADVQGLQLLCYVDGCHWDTAVVRKAQARTILTFEKNEYVKQ